MACRVENLPLAKHKGAIHAALKKLEESNKRATQTTQPASGGNKLIFLICNQPDRKNVVPLLSILESRHSM